MIFGILNTVRRKLDMPLLWPLQHKLDKLFCFPDLVYQNAVEYTVGKQPFESY